MSEIDFKGTKPALSPTSHVKEEIQPALVPSSSPKEKEIFAAPAHPPAPAPRVSPRVEKPDKAHTSPRGAPPPVPRHSVIRTNVDEESDIVHESKSEEIKTVPRGPPPPVPRPTIIKPNVPPSVPSGRTPPLPGRPPVSPKVPHQGISEHFLEHNLDSHDSQVSPPMPHGAPPPVPKGPSVMNKLPSPLVPRKINDLPQKDTNEIHKNSVDTNINAADLQDKTDTVEDVSELYAVINKPKRPTIIRPGRPSSTVKTESNTENEASSANEIKPKVSPTPRLPRNIKNESEPSNVDNSLDGSKEHSENKSDANPVPEFLRKKLKSTVDQGDKQETDESGPTAGGGPKVPLKPRPLSSKGPPPATKPKPSVLPKPQIASKPQSTVKAPETESHEATFSQNAMEKKSIENQSEFHDNEVHKEAVHEVPQQVKPAMTKRPTIIRPNKSVKTGSVENVSVESRTEKSDSDKVNLFSDDSAIDVKHRTQPPLPNKRPVSMINIHRAVENEEHNMSENLSYNSSRSIENVSEPVRPKPRPAARSRPVTMIVPPVSRPPLPSAGPKRDKSGQPSRPLGRPPVKPPAPEMDNHGKKHDSEDDVCDKKPLSQVPFGVSVFPKSEMENDSPPKPIHRPPPPMKSPRKSLDSSDDEEFVTAKEKPDRPTAAPVRRFSGSVHRDSGEDDVKKPPRPGPPPAHKDEHDEDIVKIRPPKPEGRPQRPMSMPVKQSPPQKSASQKAQGPSPGKKNLPSLPSRPKPGHPLYYHMMQVPHGIAVHDYTAQHDDELSFKTGELIILVKRVDGDWILGKVDEREGMFPQDFVKVKMPFPGEKVEDDNSSNDSAEMFYDASAEKPDTIGHGPRCRARFDFDGEGPDDLVFEEGDVIRLIEKVGLEWRKGEINGHVGLFPLSFVEIIEELPEEEEKDTGSYVKAIFDFEGEDGDLNFQAGETIKVTHMVNGEWLYGEIGVRKGQFPVQFVDHVPHGLSPLSSGDSDAKGDNFTETKVEDKLTATLSMWGDEDHYTQTDSSTGASRLDSHAQHFQDPVSMATSKSVTPYCIALYDYPAQSMDDLEFNEGDNIEIIERISADWLKGKIGGKTGMFPSAFVDVKVDITETGPTASEPDHEEVTEVYGVALYDFSGEADNELTFHAGDRFVVQDLVEGAEDWRWGVINGHRGMFPATFVEVDS
ncbi:SH3 domain-containing protein 19-like [Ruditapes philippinarum]|uniref:SH3 domain-containing protein 19-like n=1 Tax=Ruditapes philippinarum TaxID=129788 RepID=UPI00295A6C7B|nr:SH3 domain-containing protein 19-like [Ruditapes philippinarum]